jgi:hypothetical protein
VTTGTPQNISIDAASPTVPGVVQLNNAVNSTSTTQAATPAAVKQAYDLAASSGSSSTTALSTANTALTTANSACTIALNAQSCANQALINAAAAQSTANQAVTDAAVAQTTAAAAQAAANARIPCAVFLAKGNLLAGTGSGTFSVLPAGANDYILAADNTTGAGLKWVAPPPVAVTSVTGTAPITIGGGSTTPLIGVSSASTTAEGVVQLYDGLDSTSTTQALTANQGYLLQQQINAVSLSSNITLAGTIDASTGLLLTVTDEGTTAGFTVGSTLPAPAAGNDNFFVIVTTQGTMTPPGGSAQFCHVGDWWLSNGTAWQFIDAGFQPGNASTTSAGIVELATTAETQAGTDSSVAITPLGAASTYIACPALTGKGAILTASAASTPAALSVGTDGQILYACSTNPLGICWGAAPVISDATPLAEGVMYGCTIPTATSITSLGHCALASNTTGFCNTSVGNCSLKVNTTGYFNTALGSDVLLRSGIGTDNTGVGFQVLCNNTSGSYNTGVGTTALIGTTTGVGNTGVGSFTLIGNSTGSCNTGAGFAALYFATGSCNVGIGAWAGSNSGSGSNNVSIGPCVQVASAAASCQLAIGYALNCYWLTGNSTKAIKPGAGILDCLNNTGTAGQVLMSNGANAICWGTPAASIPCSCITAKGSLITGTAASTPVALNVGTDGRFLMACSTATTGLCWSCLPVATPNSHGTVIGCTNSDGVALGVQALASNSANWNTGIGQYALFSNTTGTCNTGLGLNALRLVVTGSGNTALGGNAGYCDIGCFNTLVGYMANFRFDGQTSTGCNNIVIGVCTCTATASTSNSITLGNFTQTVLRAPVTTITSLSDARDKTNVTALPVGLDFINSLNPVKFTWQQREPNEVKDGTTEAGFIAQELQAAESQYSADYLRLVYDENPDKLEASPGKLIPVLVKAIQELSAKVTELEEKLASNG